MTTDAKTPTSPTQDDDRAASQRFVWVVTALLVMINLTLAALVILERRNHQQTRDALRQEQQKNQNIAQLLLGGNMTAGPAAVNRASLPRLPGEWNGRAVTALVLPAGRGREMGFQAGDLVWVAQPAEESQTSEVPTQEPPGGSP